MAPDDPNSSWHPALMPNAAVDRHVADVPSNAPSDDATAASLSSLHDESTNTFESSERPNSLIDPPERAADPADDDVHVVEQPEDEWPVFDQPAPVATEAETEPEAPATNLAGNSVPEPEAAHSLEDAQPSGPALGHASSVSFARTVSHEPNFHDEEEEVEFSPSHMDTHPSEFMPPTDRTNSFPPVPPTKIPDDEPLPSNQAEQLMQETEDEQQDTQWNNVVDESSQVESQQHSAEPQFAAHDFLDGNEQEAGSRFMEGVPLIPQKPAVESSSDPEQAPAETAGLFEAAAGGDDDFFSQIEDHGSQNAAELDVASSLERKSTTQVLGDLGTGSLSRADTLESMPEEAEKLAPSGAEALQESAAEALVEETFAETMVDVPTATEPIPSPPAPEDLASKWQEAFAGDDDDDFLLEDSVGDSKQVDPAAFFGSDDEGFLDDEDDSTAASRPASSAPAPAPAPAPAIGSTQNSQARYTPQATPNPAQHATAKNPYAPQAPVSQSSSYFPPPAAAQPVPAPYGAQQMEPQQTASPGMFGAPPPRPDMSKAQSFADKNKGGYTSPYDLPMEVVKPRKRASMQHLSRNAQPSNLSAPPPPRSSSMNAQASAGPPPADTPSLGESPLGPPTGGTSVDAHLSGPPSVSPLAAPSPPNSGSSGQETSSQNKSAGTLKHQSSFFEDLPATSKVRPASRQSNRMPSPAPPNPPGPPQQFLPQPASSPAEPPRSDPTVMPRSSSGDIATLVAPPRTNPYATLQTQPQPSPSLPTTSRYSPAPTQTSNASLPPRPNSASRYSPMTTAAARPPVPSYNSAPPPSSAFSHQPRTSSPLAHFESSTDRAQNATLANGEPVMPERQMSSHHEPRIHRVPSLPPTHEVDEEEEFKASSGLHQAGHKPQTASAASTSRYAPSSPSTARQTPPPPPAGYAPSAMSPPKRAMSNYAPQSSVNGQAPEPGYPSHQPSQAQSAGSRRQSYADEQTAQFGARPSSSHGPVPPVTKPGLHTSASASLPIRRTRGTSQSMNMLAPTDGREKDPLQRWKGSPIIAWGISGKIATTFPKSVPRYGMGQNVPTVIRTPGEVHVRNVKDIEPLEERLATFPGPLKGKAKKKETLAWLNSGIEALEQGLAVQGVSAQQSHDEKRASERVLLWKTLKAFVEFDGTLESNAQAEKAVRDILAPGLSQADGESVSTYGSGGTSFEASGPVQPDGADASAVEQIRKHLLFGDREKAVWAAVDKRLWGHAMLISNTVSSELYKQVSQEFVRKEVNYSGHNESLAALYKVLSGNHDDCVDELVPSHARAGLQLMDPTSATGSVRDAMAGLDKWRETLGLILSNRSHDDVSALTALGNLLSSYGRAEAAHICFLFAHKVAAFGGVDDPNANFVLLGADHKTQSEQFGKEPDALLLSEVFEYGLSLAGGSMSTGLPHLAGYKLQHAVVLAEYGLRDKALAYCDVIVNSMTAQTKRSPYYHPLLETAVDDLMKRLKQSPKGESTSWISKPNLNNVSDSMWNRFNKFVAGDEADNAGAGPPADGGVETGPFGRIAGGTPTISPSPSVSNFAVYGQSSPGYPVDTPSVSAPVTRASSRYAPMAPQPNASSSPYDPASSYAPAPRSSNEFARNSYQPGRSSMESQPSFLGSGATSQPETPYGYGMAQEIPPPLPSQPQPETQPMFEPQTQISSASPHGPPHGMQEYPAAPATEVMYPNSDAITSQDGYQPNQEYQPSSHSFDPPSMTPNEPLGTQLAHDTAATGGYERPSFQPYSFEPPSYNPPPEASQDEDGDAPPMPRKKGIMDDDDDDIPALRAPTEKSKAEKDKENEEMFKKAAEEDAKRSAEQQAKKKGWGFSNWWGGKKEAGPPEPGQLNKPIKAKLGEESSFVYDPDLKRWVNKKAGAEQTQAKTATPPPPKSALRSNAGTPPPPPSSTPPMGMGQSPPPAGPPRPGLTPSASDLSNFASQESLGGPPAAGAGPPGMARSVSNISGGAAGGGPPSRPPSRPTTSMSNASSIDDLLGAAGPRKPGAKKSKRGGRYVDVMAK